VSDHLAPPGCQAWTQSHFLRLNTRQRLTAIISVIRTAARKSEVGRSRGRAPLASVRRGQRLQVHKHMRLTDRSFMQSQNRGHDRADR
jgi:hypothetical protein